MFHQYTQGTCWFTEKCVQSPMYIQPLVRNTLTQHPMDLTSP